MAKSNTQSRERKHIFSHLIKLLIMIFCICYAVSPAITLHQVQNVASLVTNYVKGKKQPNEPQPVISESEITEPGISPSTSATTDAAPTNATDTDDSTTASTDSSATSLGEYEVTGTTELALRKAPTTDSEQIATML